MKKSVFAVNGMKCVHCKVNVENAFATSCLRVHCMNEVGGLRSVEDFWKTEEVWTVNGRDCLYVVVYPFLSGCSMDFFPSYGKM